MAVTFVRWMGAHGLPRLAFRKPYRNGDLQTRLLLDPALRDDPFPLYAKLRERGALVDGRLILTTASHQVAGAILRHDGFGVGADPDALPAWLRAVLGRARRNAPVGPIDPPSLLAVNPPDHTRYRRLVGRVFTARAVEALRDRVTATAMELLDELGKAADPVDLVDTYANLLPVTVIAEILGVPAGMRAQFVAWGRAGSPVLDFGLTLRQYRAAERALSELNVWLRGHFERLRSEPGDDLLSRLVHLEDDGGLTDRELLATAGLLLAAGFETTVNLLGSGVVLLVGHPDQLARLTAEPSGWANAVEEILRYESPVQNTARRALRDVDIAGHIVREGRFVSVLIGGANRDPEVFADPDRFDVGRANARDHLAFSAGAHYCLGAALARMEGEIGLRLLFERYPDLALAGTPRRRRTKTLRGYDTLPVRLHANG